MGFDWRKSKAHLLLLNKFVNARCPDDFALSDDWKNVLGEPPQQAIKRFIDGGMLVNADLNDLLSYKSRADELKGMLRQRGLSVVGRKDELIRRLVQADPNSMEKIVAGLTLLKCTPHGQEISHEYSVAEKEKRIRTEQQVMEYLSKRKFKEASLTVAAYEAEQVFSRGMGVDWKHYNPNRDIEILAGIFGSKPKMIARLGNEKLETLHMGAAMMALWGKSTAKEWLPANFETGLPFDNDTAARMFLFHAQQQATLKEYCNSGVVKRVEILATHDSCEACKILTKKQYKLNEVPELPNEHCTHEIGCRCVIIPVID